MLITMFIYDKRSKNSIAVYQTNQKNFREANRVLTDVKGNDEMTQSFNPFKFLTVAITLVCIAQIIAPAVCRAIV